MDFLYDGKIVFFLPEKEIKITKIINIVPHRLDTEE